MNKTKIEWTDSTWNPIRGCSRVSEGCRNCYAEKVAYRFSGSGQAYEGLVQVRKTVTYPEGTRIPQWNGQVQFVAKHLLDPLKWKEPRRIFVNSMSDLFHENVSDEWIDLIFGVMAHSPQHTFQILTKRPERMMAWASAKDRVVTVYDALVDSNIADDRKADELICRGQDRILKPHPEYGYSFDCRWPLPNVWLGVSVENQAAADERIPLLLQTPAAVRFISAEPLLGPVEISSHRYPALWTTKLGWVIVGGESGPGARPMHPDWARSLRDQCQAAGVPFFFKQWGEWVPFNQPDSLYSNGPAVHYSAHGLVYLDGKNSLHPGVDLLGPEGLSTRDLDGNDGAAAMFRVGKHAAGALLDGREWRNFPEVAK